MQQPLALLSFALIAAQFMLMLAFARNRRMWQVMASNALLLLAVLTSERDGVGYGPRAV
jgi:hypothetical protein